VSLAMTYPQAVAALERALTFGMNPTLEGEAELLGELGRPQDRFASVQITGTNGKTSTSRITAALLREEGRRVGLFTSPHLHRYPERIEIDGAPVTEADFARGIEAALAAAARLRGPEAVGGPDGFTEFELLTAAALWLFAERGVETAVLEVGLGGRWDATSVVSPSVAVITGVGLDHTAILGETPEEIAADKAQIIGPASVPVLGPGTDGFDSIFLGRADELGLRARAVRADVDFSPVPEDLTVRFRVTERPNRPDGCTGLEVDGVHSRYENLAICAPSYQAANVATAIAATEAALGRELMPASIRTALTTITLPGRFELVRSDPPVIIDGSHNPQAVAVLAETIREAFPSPQHRPAILLGILADKDAAGMAKALAGLGCEIAVTRPDSPRALAAADLAAVVERATGTVPQRFDSVPEALAALLPTSPFGLVVAGSLTTAGEARCYLLDGSETAPC
jgi:dihydrofolate synthase / folylpolyglutamate synthase